MMQKREQVEPVILHVPPGSPGWMFAAADTLLALHIGGGAVGVVSGGTTLVARKGGRLHRVAGTVFLAAMLVMAGIGAAVAPFLPDRPSALAGVLTLYLVLTGWMTMKQKPGKTGALEIGGLLIALSVAAAGMILIRLAANSPTHRLDGEPAMALYLFVIVGMIAAAGDARVLLRGGIAGAQRLARHLWRMCFALFVAAASFFLGQTKILPALMRGSPLLFVPAFAPLGVMAFWLIRVRLAKGLRGFASARPSGIDNRLEAA